MKKIRTDFFYTNGANVNVKAYRLGIAVGWYHDEPPALFDLQILEVNTDLALVTIFQIKIAKLILGLYWDFYR